MRKMFTCSFFMVILLLAAAPCFANNGETLLRECTAYIHLKDNIRNADGEKADAIDANSCLNYMYGTVDVLYYYIPFFILEKKELEEKAAHNICLPEKFDIDDAIRVVVDYLEDHKDDLAWHKMALILAALQEEFPCKN